MTFQFNKLFIPLSLLGLTSMCLSQGGLANSAWPKFHANHENTGQGLGSGARGRMAWRFTADSAPQGTVIAADGSIITCSYSGTVYSLNSKTGSRNWSLNLGGNITSVPAISGDGTIYIGNWNSNFYAISKSGTIKWQVNTGNVVNSSPDIADDGTIFFGSYDGNMYAYNPNGTMKWSFQTGNLIASAPCVSPDGRLYVTSYSGYLFALDKNTGGLIWSQFVSNGGIESSPCVDPTGNIFLGGINGNVYSFDSAGNLRWSYPTGGQINNAPALSKDGRVTIGSFDGFLYSLTTSGNLVWKVNCGNIIWASHPAIGSDGTCYVGTYNGGGPSNFIAISPTGQVRWSFATNSGIQSSPAISSNGMVFVGMDGKLCAIK